MQSLAYQNDFANTPASNDGLSFSVASGRFPAVRCQVGLTRNMCLASPAGASLEATGNADAFYATNPVGLVRCAGTLDLRFSAHVGRQ